MIKRFFHLIVTICFLYATSCAQPLNHKMSYTHQDTLRGSVTAERKWWDVLYYDITVTPDYATKSIVGMTSIKYKVTSTEQTNYIQIDLQQPLQIDAVYYNAKPVAAGEKNYYNEGNVWHIAVPKSPVNSIQTLSIQYHGVPREAIRPPWDGGWIWTKDSRKEPWMSVACQGLGASVWYPCKDYQGDEPDEGAVLRITVPDTLIAVGNGRLENRQLAMHKTTYTWQVKSPINNYDIIPYIGEYVNWSDTLMGEKGKLDLNYWVLAPDEQKARKQFEQVKPMLRAFEYWFGPYPFYEDGYKLVQAPHLGMEHQSAVAYGNKFMNGYLGGDLSGTGWGLKWDYIIVHESGHEWFGNNITTKDIADMWVHEGFTDYSEALFIEYYYGKKAADEYVQGLRKNIENDKPIIGPYGVNQEGSGDMYFKGANMLHTIRQVINDDNKFREILRGLNKTFYHQTVTTAQIEGYMARESGKDLKDIFDQYLRSTSIPTLEIKANGNSTSYRWTDCIRGFHMPVKLTNGTWLYPTSEWKSVQLSSDKLQVDLNFFIKSKKD